MFLVSHIWTFPESLLNDPWELHKLSSKQNTSHEAWEINAALSERHIFWARVLKAVTVFDMACSGQRERKNHTEKCTQNNNNNWGLLSDLKFQAASLWLITISPILLSHLWMNKSSLIFFPPSHYTHTLKTPTCPSACSTLTSAGIPTTLTPPTAVCCIPSAERQKKMTEIGYCICCKKPWSWFSLGAIKKRHGANSRGDTGSEAERLLFRFLSQLIMGPWANRTASLWLLTRGQVEVGPRTRLDLIFLTWN